MEENIFGQKIGWNRTKVTQPSFDAAKTICDLAHGLTYDQFIIALRMALEDVEANLTLITPPVQKINDLR